MTSPPIDFSGVVLVDAEAAAAILSVTRGTLAKWRCTGTGPRYVLLGRSVRYSRQELETYIQARTRSHTSDAGSLPVTG